MQNKMSRILLQLMPDKTCAGILFFLTIFFHYINVGWVIALPIALIGVKKMGKTIAHPTILLIILLLSCNNTEPAEQFGAAYRISHGKFRDNQLRFHHNENKLLLLRHFPEADDDVLKNKKPMSRKIFEIDFSKIGYPTEREIVAFEGGSDPSYAGNNGIIALDKKGSLVFLKNGQKDPQPIVFESKTSLPLNPVKPVGSPDGQKLAFLSFPPIEFAKLKESRPDSSNNYQVYVANLDGSGLTHIEQSPDVKAKVVAVDFADPENIQIRYQLLDRRDGFTRIERVNIKSGERFLSFFINGVRMSSFNKSCSFFVSLNKAENGILFSNRTLDISEEMIFDKPMVSFRLSPNGMFAGSTAFFEDSKGVNLLLVKVPRKFSELVVD